MSKVAGNEEGPYTVFQTIAEMSRPVVVAPAEEKDGDLTRMTAAKKASKRKQPASARKPRKTASKKAAPAKQEQAAAEATATAAPTAAPEKAEKAENPETEMSTSDWLQHITQEAEAAPAVPPVAV